MNSNVGQLLEMAQAIEQIDLGVTIRRAYDTFCEQVVDYRVALGPLKRQARH